MASDLSMPKEGAIADEQSITGDKTVVIRNSSRWLVPTGIAASVLVMFVPPLALSAVHSTEPAKAIAGAVAVTLTGLYFIYSALFAPVEARIGERITVHRPAKESHYELSQIRRWFFAIPNGLPTQSAPGTNAMLHIMLQDRTHFRGEVTADEAAQLAERLPHVANTNANATR